MARRKIVDAHHHLWKLSDGYKYPWLQDKPSGEGLLGSLVPITHDYLAADYRADTTNYDVVKTVHVEAVPLNAVDETEWLQANADRERLPDAIVGRVELASPDAEKLMAQHKAHRNVRGIRHIANWHPDGRFTFSDHDYLTDPAWIAGYRLLRKYDLSFDLQIYAGQMRSAAALARANPDTLMILNHTGMPLVVNDADVEVWRKGMRALAAEPNTYVKISGLGMVDHRWSEASIRPWVLETIDIFGTDRAMFGSNFPVDKLYSSFDVLYGAFETIVAAFSETEKAKLFHDNALRVYRI